ncbi:MAG: phosphonate dehydrogenase [Pseudomonadota bacterium]
MQQAKIVVTSRIHAAVRDRLACEHDVVCNDTTLPWTPEKLADEAHDAHALMVFMPDRISRETLDACPRLRVVAGALKGYDNLDRNACTERGVWLTNVPDLLTVPTAELAVGLTIALTRNVMAGDQHVRSGVFAGWRPSLYGLGLAEATVGIVGMGAVGQAITERLKGFAPKVVYADPHPLTKERETQLGAQPVSMDELLATSDIVVLAIHLIEMTMHTIDKDALRQMKPGSYLINPGRGSLVCETAVADALDSGHLAGYAADVFEMEDWARADRPRSIDRRLLDDQARTVFTPHLGSATQKARFDIEMSAATNILEALAGRRPPDAVNDVARRRGR